MMMLKEISVTYRLSGEIPERVRFVRQALCNLEGIFRILQAFEELLKYHNLPDDLQKEMRRILSIKENI